MPGPDGTLPDWDVIYDKAIAAGKSIWVKVYSGEFEELDPQRRPNCK